LKAIHDQLVVLARPGYTASFVLYGLGGIGKTQIAIRYAYKHKSTFDIVWWLHANDWKRLVDSYVEMSRSPELRLLGLPIFPAETAGDVIAEQMKLLV
jgi:hypothetical protein